MVPCGSWWAASVQSTPAHEVVASEMQTSFSGWKPMSQAVRMQAAGVEAVEGAQPPLPLVKARVQSTGGDPQAVSLFAVQDVPWRCWPAGQSQRLLVQTVEAQSAPELQCKVAPQAAQVPPPQSTSLSGPLRLPSVQLAAPAGWQTPSTHA